MPDSMTLVDFPPLTPEERERKHKAERIIASAERLYCLENVRPLWPEEGADLSFLLPRYDRDDYDWAIWRQYFIDCRIWPELWTQGYVNPTSKLLHGAMQLPESVLQAAHHRLFGHKTDCPTATAVLFIAAALFNPMEPIRIVHGAGQTWQSIVDEANRRRQKQIEAKQSVDDLLKGWG